MKKSAVIVAGGSGTRMNAGMPKQFLLLNGKPLLMYSIEAFNVAFPGISVILVLPATELLPWKQLCDEYAFNLPCTLVAGGETRFHSVQNALAVMDDGGLVAIHDGARPLVSPSLIRNTFLTAGQLGNAVPVIEFSDSVRKVSGKGSQPVDRSILRLVQTPQVFNISILKKAYHQEYRTTFTDDASVMESAGETIHLTEGDPVNLKITHPYDLAAAEIMLKNVQF
ncbi:MAG: 2-C-methyl-D-erythritol 4-phosphate cytidylyltransferase [Bacteroidales bacterium]